MATTYTRRLTIWINGKEVENNIKSIKGEMNKLVNEQKRMVIGSKEYVAAAKEIKNLNGIIANHNAELRGAVGGWSRLKIAAEAMNRYFLMLSSVVAGLGGLLMSGKKAVSMFAEFDDQVADVKRTTGMTRDEIYAMNESLKKVDTRTAQLDLMKLGMIAGKLGIAKKDVEGFITAADKISVALSGALGSDTEEAINQIGKMVDVFKVKDKFGIEDSMLKVGSALNSLGNASTANEGYIVEFTKRVGGIAPTVGVSIQSVMGLAATLDQLGQTSEVSSTVYSAMITGMFKNTGEYAKIAGMGIKEFKDLLGKDTNEAFIKILEGLKGTNGGMERLVALMGDIGMDGKRSASVLGVLSNNTQLLREQQDVSNTSFEKGTGILDAFNSKNNSAQALLDKARKRMDNLAISLGEKLLPVLTLSTNGFSYFVKYVGILVDFTIKHSTAILTIGAALLAYTVASKAAAVIENFRTAGTKQSIFMAQLETYWIRLKILLTNEATIAQKRALVANKALGASMTATPWGAIAAAVVIVTMAIIEFVKNATKASAAQEALNNARSSAVENTVNETSKVDLLVKMINSENVSMAGKRKAIEDLQKIIPGYTAMLDAQGKVIYQNTQSVKEYIEQLRKQYMLQAYQDEFGKASKELASAQDERDQKALTVKPTKGKRTGWTDMATGQGGLDAANKKVSDAQSKVDALQNKIESSINAINDYSGKILEAANNFNIDNDLLNQKNIKLTEEQTKRIKQSRAEHLAEFIKYRNLSKGISTEGGNAGAPPETPAGGSAGETPDEKAIKAAETAYKQQQEIKKKAIELSISLMQEGADKELAVLQEKFVTEREAIYRELETNKTLTEAQKKILNQSLIDLQAGYDKSEESIYRNKTLNELKFQKEITALKLESVKSGSAEEYQLKKQLLDQQMQIDIASLTGSEEQKQQQISLIKLKYAAKQAKEDETYSLKFLDDKLKQDITALNDGEQKKLEVLKQKRASGEISRKEYNKQLLAIQVQYTQASLAISIDKAQRELEILKAAGEDTTQAEAALADLRLEAQKAGTGKEGNPDKPEWTGKDTANASVESAQMIADATFQISRDKNQRELDDKLSQLSTLRDAELSNKRLTENQKDAINAKYAAKEKILKQNAWKQQHKADLAQAWVNLALSVGKAAINVWPLPAIPMMAMAALQGGLQIAAISAQKMPAFSEGGFTSRNSDNLTPAGIVHANEYVIPAEGVHNPQLQPFLKMIEVARLKKSLPTLNPALLNSNTVGRFSSGGFTSEPLANNFEQDWMDALSGQLDKKHRRIYSPMDVVQMKVLNKLTKAVEELQNKGVKGTWVLNDLEKIQKDKSNIQSATNM